VKAGILLAAAVLIAWAPAGADAHAVGLSRGEYCRSGASLAVRLTFARRELMEAVPGLDADGDGEILPRELAAATAALGERIAGGIEVQGEGGSCGGRLDGAVLTESDGLAIAATFACADGTGALSIHLGFLGHLSLGHRHLAAVTGGGAERQVAYEGRPDLTMDGAIAAPASGAAVAWTLFRLGIRHILTGYDHLLFLFGLVLVGDRLSRHLLAVTAFTLGHSVTLALAALEIWAPGGRVVEPAIALSIAYVGIENWLVRDASRRWRITLPFGLVHGFGFAGALREVALPSAQVPLALASFNAGVEAGQVAVLFPVLMVVLRLARRSWFAERVAKLMSAGIAVAGLVWFAERVG
jgi:hypothetical protein